MSEEPPECHANPGGFARAMAYIEEVQVRRFVPCPGGGKESGRHLELLFHLFYASPRCELACEMQVRWRLLISTIPEAAPSRTRRDISTIPESLRGQGCWKVVN